MTVVICFYIENKILLFERERERGMERERAAEEMETDTIIFHPLVHHPHGHNSQVLGQQNPRISILILHMSGRVSDI